MKNLIRIGEVSSVNEGSGSARVVFSDRSDLVSYELPVMKQAWPIANGDHVVCLFLPTGIADGFVIGAYFTEDDPPPAGGV